MSEEFYTVEHAAERLRLHPKTVLRFIKEGRLKATRLGKSYRILRSDLDAAAGVAPRADTSAGAVRATCVVDAPEVSPALASRLMSVIPATLNARGQGAAPARADVIYDPERRSLKIIVVADPADAGALLRLIPIWLEG